MKKLIGVENVSYTSSKTGQLVTGVRIFVTSDLTLPSTGVRCDEYFIPGRSVSEFPLGDIVAPTFEPGFVKGQMRCTGIIYPAPADNKK